MILVYEHCYSDGCTYNCDTPIFFEAESKEAAYLELCDRLAKADPRYPIISIGKYDDIRLYEEALELNHWIADEKYIENNLFTLDEYVKLKNQGKNW